MKYTRSFQDLGTLEATIRTEDAIGPSGVNVLQPDEEKSHIEAVAQIREIIDEHYGESIARLSEDDERVIINRAVIRAETVPHIEYTVVDSRNE